tara:strand:+ start:1268 stop:2065 length:798 start_codon:yes stop_codon:yes gene_type:complete
MDIYKKYNIKIDQNYKRSSKHRFYFYLRKLFFTTLGFFLKTIFKVSNKTPNKEIIILGRGKSTNYFFKEHKKFKKINDIFLVNFSSKDFPKNYINVFKDKIIFLFINFVEPIPSIKILRNLIISRVFLGRCASMANTHYGKRKSFKSNILYERFSYLPDSLLKYWWLNNNGLICICYAANLGSIKKIHLFGFNFYHDDYIKNSIKTEVEFSDPKHEKELKDAKLKLKKHFILLVKSFPKVNFYIYLNKNIFPTKPKNLFVKILNH